MSLPSLEAYILASQDEMGCWVWRRSDDTRAFPGDPETHVGAAAAIVLPALGVRLPLADVYRGIVEA